MNISSLQITEILGGESKGSSPDRCIKYISINTNNIIYPEFTLFAALPGNITHGQKYISKAYEIGVRLFLVTSYDTVVHFNKATYIVVPDVLKALQNLAKYHREKFSLPIIGITGSNGKTIIKEWLYQMLYDTFNIVKSPKSYNSQIGVPLSLFRIDKSHNLGIIESGISTINEMKNHLEMISPDIGIFSNIGDAHNLGFKSLEEKIREKAILFKDSKVIICCKDHKIIYRFLKDTYPNKEIITWSKEDKTAPIFYNPKKEDPHEFEVHIEGNKYNWQFEFSDQSSIENIMHCISLMHYLSIIPSEIGKKIKMVSGLEMRLEMKEGLYGSTIINDAYSADLSALQVALDFMQKQEPNAKNSMVILSKLEQSGMKEHHVLLHIQRLITKYNVDSLHYISDSIETLPNPFYKYQSKKAFIESLPDIDLKNKTILVKGSRSAKLEDVVHKLSIKTHSTKLTINLDALAHNIRTYKSMLRPTTKVIAVIKASAYGSGSVEIARVLYIQGVDYLAVAFIDEGVELRKKGVTMPIIVLNSDSQSLIEVLDYSLELEVYCISQLRSIVNFSNRNEKILNIHIKLDTGMNRLGFQEHNISELITILKESRFVIVKSIFSHLASSDSQIDDEFTQDQFSLFEKMYNNITDELGVKPDRHILNSSGISRFTDHQYEMVRLGLGLYGFDSGMKINEKLQKVHSLTSTILQIKEVPAESGIGYNHKTILSKQSTIGIINIGYADGLMRNLGNEKYSVLIKNIKAKILGTISMDLIIVNLSDIPNVKVGDEVVIFNEKHPLENLAKAAETIPYEILSRISNRVRRVYTRS